MSIDSWLSEVDAFAVTRIHPNREFAALSTELLDLLLLAQSAPPDLEQGFEAVPDQRLHELVAAAEARLLRGVSSVDLAGGTGPEAFLGVAVQIRALDRVLHQTRDRGPSVFDTHRWRLAGKRGSGYLIPRTRPRWKPPAREGRRNDLGKFAHRALEHHRMLPAELMSYEVVLHTCEAVFEGELRELRYGGALFPELGFTERDTERGFIITGVTCEGQESVVDSHLANAHASRCAVLVFPELTIDPHMRGRIKRDLQERPWRRKHGSWTIPVVVAGSWHEAKDGGFFNVAPIFDGWGGSF
jgi:hypothetical protein